MLASAGAGFGVSSNSGEDVDQVGYPSDDELEYEEVDFDYAASVVAETWELFEEADAQQRVCTGPVSKIRNSENKKLPCQSRRPVRQTGLVPPPYPPKTR